MIKVATALGNRLSMSAKNCDFNIHNSNFKFNINGRCCFECCYGSYIISTLGIIHIDLPCLPLLASTALICD